MPLVLHLSHLIPLILFDAIFLYSVESLFSTEAAQDIRVAFTKCDGMGVSAFVHRGPGYHLVLLGKVDADVLLGGTAPSSDQDFHRRESDGS